MRVALKGIDGVSTVEVSLSTGTASVTFAPGNHVQYRQLLSAIAKNGFVTKGATVIADGTLAGDGELRVSGSNEQFRLVPQSAGTPAPPTSAKTVEVTGLIAEVEKGKTADVIRYTAISEK